MTLNLSSIRPITLPEQEPPTGAPKGATAFGDILGAAINQVEGSRNEAKDSIDKFLAGDGGDDLHTTILTAQRADLEFQMFMQVRNKVVNAYQEIMKMQI